MLLNVYYHIFRCLNAVRKLEERDSECAELKEKYAELEAIARVNRNSRTDKTSDDIRGSGDVARSNPEVSCLDPEGAVKSEDVGYSQDHGNDLKEANVWWSYVWHAMSQSESARLEREHETAFNMLMTVDGAPSSLEAAQNDAPAGAASVNYYTDAITRLQRSISEFKSNSSAQAIEIAAARQVHCLHILHQLKCSCYFLTENPRIYCLTV